MFDTLLESRGARRPRTPAGRGGVVVSALLHAALIGGAVAATGRAATVRREPPPRPLVYVAPPRPAERTRPTPSHDAHVGAHGPASPAPAREVTSPRIALPPVLTLPTRIALPTAGAHPTAASTAEFSRGGLGGTEADAGGGGLGSGDGPWSATTVDRAVAILVGPVPRYPEALCAAGTDGRVLVRFVVDTAGRVERGSVQVLRADDPRFADAVRAVLPSFRFAAAEAGGRRVRQLVEAPFEFTVRR